MAIYETVRSCWTKIRRQEDRISFVTCKQIVGLSCWSEAKASRKSNGPNLLATKNLRPRPKRETEAVTSWISCGDGLEEAPSSKYWRIQGTKKFRTGAQEDRLLDTTRRVRKDRGAQGILVHPSLTPLHYPTVEVAVMSAHLQSGATIAAKTRTCRPQQPEGSK